jgi:single-strand DNA-binding protein
MNIVILIGNLARDPEMRYGQNNLAIAKFSVAVNRPPRSGEDAGADFIRVTAFGKQAELVERYLTKGRKVAVEGRIQTGSYDGKDGQKVYTTDVIANRVEFLGSRGDGGDSGGGAYRGGQSQGGQGGGQSGGQGGGWGGGAGDSDPFGGSAPQNTGGSPQDVPTAFAEMDGDDDLPF